MQAEAREQCQRLIVRTSSARPTRAAASPRRRSGGLPCRSRSCLMQRGERRLDARRAAEAMARCARRPRAARGRPAARRRAARARCASVSRCQTASKIVSCSASSRASVACRCSSVARRPPAVAHVVPGFVREPLHVVGQVAGEVDDRRAEARLRRGCRSWRIALR